MNNNCATGSTALFLANNDVKSGLVDCALALGFERMAPGSLGPGANFRDRVPPTLLFGKRTTELEDTLTLGTNFGPAAPRMFCNAGQEYMDKFGAEVKHLAMIGIL